MSWTEEQRRELHRLWRLGTPVPTVAGEHDLVELDIEDFIIDVVSPSAVILSAYIAVRTFGSQPIFPEGWWLELPWHSEHADVRTPDRDGFYRYPGWRAPASEVLNSLPESERKLPRHRVGWLTASSFRLPPQKSGASESIHITLCTSEGEYSVIASAIPNWSGYDRGIMQPAKPRMGGGLYERNLDQGDSTSLDPIAYGTPLTDLRSETMNLQTATRSDSCDQTDPGRH